MNGKDALYGRIGKSHPYYLYISALSEMQIELLSGIFMGDLICKYYYYIGGAEGHEYPDLQVRDEVNPRTFLFALS